MLAEEAEAWRRESERCREEMAEIHRQIEREGVSTHVVYGLEMIERCLTRMAMMLDIMAAPSEREAATALHRLFARLASSVNDDRSVRHLTWWTTHLLQRRIVERSGRTGEHYIANTRSEYRHLWLAALGGGLLTVGTAAIKTAISGWHALADGLAGGAGQHTEPEARTSHPPRQISPSSQSSLPLARSQPSPSLASAQAPSSAKVIARDHTLGRQ